jgi:hypothetical protein
MIKQLHYFLLGDVARKLQCQPYRIVYLLTTGKVPEPPRLGNRRLFQPTDVHQIALKLGIELQEVEGATR